MEASTAQYFLPFRGGSGSGEKKKYKNIRTAIDKTVLTRYALGTI